VCSQVVEVCSLSAAQDSGPVVVGTVKQGNQEIGLKQQSGLRRFYLGLAAVFDGAGM
jgi:hypothetical protein